MASAWVPDPQTRTAFPGKLVVRGSRAPLRQRRGTGLLTGGKLVLTVIFLIAVTTKASFLKSPLGTIAHSSKNSLGINDIGSGHTVLDR